MNSSAPTSQRPVEGIGAPKLYEIAIHIGLPENEAVRLAFGTDVPFIFGHFALGLRCLLRHTLGVDQQEFGAHGDLINGLIRFRTADRSRVKDLILEFFRLPDFVEIAWHDEAELCWRTMHPASSAQPFERWLTDAQDTDRAQRPPLMSAVTQALAEINPDNPAAPSAPQ